MSGATCGPDPAARTQQRNSAQIRELQQTLAASLKILDVSARTIERLSTFLAQAEPSEVDALSEVSGMVRGVRGHGLFSLQTFAEAQDRQLNKPMAVVLKTDGKDKTINVELVTGRVRFMLEY